MFRSPTSLAAVIAVSLMALGLSVYLSWANGEVSYRNVSVPDLIKLYDEATNSCGEGGNEAQETRRPSCLKRAKIGRVLNSKSWCFGEGVRSSSEARWRPCLTPTALAAVNARMEEDAQWDRMGENEIRQNQARAQWASLSRPVTEDFRVPIGAQLSLFVGAFSPKGCWDVEGLHQCEVSFPPAEGCPTQAPCLKATYNFREDRLTGVIAEVDLASWLTLLARTKSKYGEPIARRSPLGPAAFYEAIWRTDGGEYSFIHFEGADVYGAPINPDYSISYSLNDDGSD